MAKNHIIFLTEDELKAIANGYRIARKLAGETDYIQGLEESGGKTGYDKLLEKIQEIKKNGTDGK